MIETISNDPAGWSGLRPVDISDLRSFEVRAGSSGQTVIVTTESTDGRSRLQATFVGVVGLQLSWPEQQPVSLDVVEIGDVSAHGLEDISFRVAEGAGFFAFSCREFFAVAIRET